MVVLTKARIVEIRNELVSESPVGVLNSIHATHRLRVCQSRPHHVTYACRPTTTFVRPFIGSHQFAPHVWHSRRVGLGTGGR